MEPKFQAHFVAAMAIPHAIASYPSLSKVVTLPAPKPRDANDEGGGSDGGGRRRRRRG